MDFPKEFFEGEIRNGFYIEPMMKKAWAAQLEVLREIDRVCKKHNIQYYAEWGTLLGTIRHNGFIPWDDDMDICMKRNDYNRFLQVAKKELPVDFCVVNIHTSDEFTQMLTRVTNGDKIRFDKGHLERFHGCPYAVGLDIFPMDFIAPTKEEDDLQCQLVNMVLSTAASIEAFEAVEGATQEEINNLVLQIQNVCGVKFEEGKSTKNQLYKLGERLCSLYREEEAEEITLMVDHACNRPEYRIPKMCYEQVIEMPFENIKMPVPTGYETILPIKYGDNYMTPLIRVGGHEYPFYKSQQRIAYRALGYTPK